VSVPVYVISQDKIHILIVGILIKNIIFNTKMKKIITTWGQIQPCEIFINNNLNFYCAFENDFCAAQKKKPVALRRPEKSTKGAQNRTYTYSFCRTRSDLYLL